MRDSKESSTGFHLQYEMDNEAFAGFRDDRSVTGSSLYDKQRIDSMFDETRSQISGQSQTKEPFGHSYEIPGLVKPKITNCVQARIEEMFTEINITEYTCDSVKEKNQYFPVAYLGSIPITAKVTSLEALQPPLKSLYFKYLRNGPPLKSLQATLEITKSGLKITHRRKNGTRQLEQVNPFQTIAVWAAVKFVYRNKVTSKECAFLPLIADPDSIEKTNLFKSLKPNEEILFCNSQYEESLPLFTVVMKQISLSKQLECHAFICSSAEHAIIMAANLYTALLQRMPMISLNSKNDKNKPNNCWPESSGDPPKAETKEATEVPVRPPRRPKSTGSNSTRSRSSSIDPKYNVIEVKEKPPERKTTDLGVAKTTEIKSEKPDKLQMYNSGMSQFASQDRGDILTKVAIPRSKSFLNAGGPFCSRYTASLNDIGTSKSRQKGSIARSPLGFDELFQEFRNEEGLYNLDDILSAIINTDGMSFNDLKPIYKEFVLKLALTLTKDELYHRSKCIMQKQKYKRQQLKKRNNCKFKRTFVTGGGLKKALKKSVIHLKTPKRRNSFEFTSRLFPSSKYTTPSPKPSKVKSKLLIDSIDNQSLNRMRYKGLSRSSVSKKSLRRSSSLLSFTLKLDKDQSKERLNQTSSGYFSCSECSYDSETCTCTSAEKCYCSLGKRPSKMCSLDTDSCFESDKCYCNQTAEKSIFEQLKQQGFAASESSASRSESPLQETTNQIFLKSQSQAKIDNSSKSSKSLDFLQWKTTKFCQCPSETKCTCDKMSNCSHESSRISIENNLKTQSPKYSSDNLALDYEMFNLKNKKDREKEKKVLVVSARDPWGKVTCLGTTQNSNSSETRTCPSISVASDALSVKKSAEIAALFCQLKPDKEIIYNSLDNSDYFKVKNFKKGYTESNIGNSLGYFP